MSITISNKGNFINVDFGTHSSNFLKSDLEIKREGNFVYLKYNRFCNKLLYTDVLIPASTSSLDLETQLLGWVNNPGGFGGSCMQTVGNRFQVFISTVGQVIFTPQYFTVTENTPVYINGYLSVEGWTIINGSVVLDNAQPAGSVIVLENPNNIIIERTTQVFPAIMGQTDFTTIFDVTQDSKVYVNGWKSEYGVDWTIILGVITFLNPMVGGETIVVTK